MPRPSSACLTVASARICPSCTRKCRFAITPASLGFRVSMNTPPTLKSCTRATSSRPSHRQYTHTCCGVSTRVLSLRDGELRGCNCRTILATIHCENIRSGKLPPKPSPVPTSLQPAWVRRMEASCSVLAPPVPRHQENPLSLWKTTRPLNRRNSLILATIPHSPPCPRFPVRSLALGPPSVPNAGVVL
jgi:hypothetical protein